MTDRYYTVKEAAEVYFQNKVSARAVYVLFSRGELRGFRVGAKILIYESSLNAYRREQENSLPVAPLPPAPPPQPSRRKASVPVIRLNQLPEEPSPSPRMTP
jgi:excisionase family DNA binding protein